MELDPLLKDLSEKKQTFRRNVVSLASELKDVRYRLAQQEQSIARETRTRQAAETKAKSMEEQICQLHRCLDRKDEQLQTSTSTAEQYLRDLDDVKSQLSSTQAAADASVASAQAAQAQCLLLLKELDEKNTSLMEHEERVNKFAEQLIILQKDLQTRESSQKQLKEEVTRIEKEIMLAVARGGTKKDRELRMILEEISPKNYENINKHLNVIDEEIARLKDEIKSLSAYWNHKTKELELQLDKHNKADQELKKRILKLEFCLQESRAQTRKLQRIDERRENAIKELRDQLAMKQQNGCSSLDNHNFWESSGFKMLASMSMLVLVVFARR